MYFDPFVLPPLQKGNGMQGEGIIMISDEVHNLKEQSLLVNSPKMGYRQGILCNHHTHPSLRDFEGDEEKEDDDTIRVGCI